VNATAAHNLQAVPAHTARPAARCLHGHFMAATATQCQTAGCGAPRRPRLSLVKAVTRLLPPLDRRTPHDDNPGACAFAVHAAALLAVPARVLEWRHRPDGTVYQTLDDGTLLTHSGTYGDLLTATITCTHGAAHQYILTSRESLPVARQNADTCDILHNRPLGAGYRDMGAAFSAYRTTRVRPLHQKSQTQTQPETAER
jgi:hypothetical protein